MGCVTLDAIVGIVVTSNGRYFISGSSLHTIFERVTQFGDRFLESKIEKSRLNWGKSGSLVSPQMQQMHSWRTFRTSECLTGSRLETQIVFGRKHVDC